MLLTIAIPTFNRPQKLLERIGELSILAKDSADQIELLICDNSEIRFEPPSNIPFLTIRYLKNSKNIGLGGNINQCVLNASGIFVWLCSDDDQINPEAISELLKLLSATNADVIALADDREYELAISEVREFNTIPVFWESFIFLSACIYRRDAVQNFLLNKDNHQVNATYQQVLLALGLSNVGSLMACWKNIFVLDTLTHKEYGVRSSYVVRILDLMKLENQLSVMGLNSNNYELLSAKIDSHILNYIPNMIFEFSSRKEFADLLALVLKSFTVSRLYLNRLILLLIATFFVSVSIIDCRVARILLKFTEKLTQRRVVTYPSSRKLVKRNPKEVVDASTFGYEGE